MEFKRGGEGKNKDKTRHSRCVFCSKPFNSLDRFVYITFNTYTHI